MREQASPPEEGGEKLSFRADSLSPTVGRLGLVAGLLSPGSDKTQLDLDTAWFGNPLAEPSVNDPNRRSIRTIPTNVEQRQELLNLFEELLGSVSAESLGIPATVAGRKWYPIQNPLAETGDTNRDTGLYLVSEQLPVSGGSSETVLGLGAMHTFDVLGVRIEPYAYFPFLRMPPPANGSTFVLGDPAYPIELGIEVLSPGGPFGTDELSFDGVKVAAKIEFTDHPLRLDLVLLNLKRPGHPVADTNINDILKTPANEWVATGAYLLVSQLVKAAPGDLAAEFRNAANALLAVLGLTGSTPPIDWNAVAGDPAQTGEILAAWLKSIASNPVQLGEWLNQWYCLVHGVKADPDKPFVEGAGTRSDPWRVEVLAIDENVIDFTVATSVDQATKGLLIYPGVRIRSKLAHPVASVPAVGVRMQAAAEILEIALPSDGTAIPIPTIFPSFEALAVLLNPTDAFRTPTLEPDGAALIAIGSIQAGFNYRTAPKDARGAAGVGGDLLKGIYPAFRLTEVKTPYGAWDAIDLTNFGELIQTAGELLADLVVAKLEEFFDESGSSEAAKMARCLAAVLGVKPPPGYTVETWPVKELLLNGPGGVQALISDPTGTLAGYLQRCLTAKNTEGKTAYELLLPSFAGILGDVAAGMATGTGTADDPWQVELFNISPVAPAAYLQAWQSGAVLDADIPIVRMGIAFKVPLPVKAVAMSFSLNADLVDLRLPDAAGKGAGANWLPGAAALFRVTGPADGGKPTPLVTPELGGIAVSADAFLTSAAWTREPASPEQAELPNSDFFSVVRLASVKLLNGGAVVEDIGNVEFSFTPTSWQIPDLGKFTQLFFDAAGIWILAYGGKFGVPLVAVFGLSPDLAAVFNNPPEGGYPFELPALKLAPGWPRLKVTNSSSGSFFADPWSSMRAQLAAVFGGKDTAIPMTRMLGWAVTGALPPEPVPTPAGTRADPWSVFFTNVWGLTPLFWTVAGGGAATRLGIGVQRTMLTESALGIDFGVIARVDICEFNIATGVAADVLGTLPYGSLLATLKNTDPAKPLVDDAVTGLQIGSAEVGSSVDCNGVHPVLVLYKARYDQSAPPRTIDLADALGGSEISQALESLVYALMKKISAEITSMPGVRSFVDLIALLGLVLEPDANGVYGINLGAWLSLVAEPIGFLSEQTAQVLEDSTALAAFHRNLATLLGYASFHPPESLAGLPDLLVALELATLSAGGYALRLSQWIPLIQNPVQYLTTQGKRLLNPADDSVRMALVTALSKLPPPDPAIPLPDLPLTIRNNTLITLRIPADKLIRFGTVLAVDAELTANIQSLSLTTEIHVSCEFAGLSLTFRSELAIGAGLLLGVRLAEIATQWGLELGGAHDQNVPPPFEPIIFYPLPGEAARIEYLKKLGVQIPIALISSLAAQLVNSFVVGDGAEAKYPVVHRILDNLGLTIPNATPGNLSQVQSLAGLMMHPWQWVVSKRALGDGAGGFDLDKVGKLLHDLPGPNGVVGPGNIKLVEDGPQGMKITGLPFGTSSVSFGADSIAGIQIGAALSYAFEIFTEAQLRAARVEITPKIDIEAHLAFGLGAGVAVGGSVAPNFVFDIADPDKPTTLAITAAYGAKECFALTLAGQLDGAPFPPGGGQIFLVPFGGLSQFQAGVTALLDFAARQLIDLFNKYKADPDHNKAVVQLVDNLMGIAGFFGITSVSTLFSIFEQVRSDPVAWLIQFFEPPKLPDTLAQVAKLFSAAYLDVPGFTVEATLLKYRPPSLPVASGTIEILLGQREGVFGVWVEPGVQNGWIDIGAQAGVGLTTPLSGNSAVRFTLSASGGLAKDALPAQMPGAPTINVGLSVGVGADVKYFLRFYPAGEGTRASTLLVQLLPPPPHFAFGDDLAKVIPPLEWLPQFALAFLVPLVADIVLQTEKVGGWLNEPMLSGQPSSPKPGPLLTDWGMLVAAKPGPPVVYALHDIATMFDDGHGQRLPPLEIVEKLFFVVLKALDGFKLVPIGADGGIFIASSPGGADATDYGMRLLIPDIWIWGKTQEGAAAEGSTALLAQLGKWLSSRQGCRENWIVESDPSLKDIVKEPGVLFYFVRLTKAAIGGMDELAFHPKLQLVSVGVDFTGTNGKPLVNVNGFQIGKIEPRLYFSLEFEQPAMLQVGAAIECQGIGVPLGPAQITSGTNKNPVAQNLLASGGEDESGGKGDAGETKSSVNPTFSIDLGYVFNPANSTTVYAKLFSDAEDGTCSNFIWIPVQRSFGPINCQKVGFGWEPENPLLDAGFDGSVTLAGLSLGLVNLKVGIPVTDPLNYGAYTLGLDGIDVSYHGGPVAITGGFLKTERIIEGQTVVEYTGVASLMVSSFGLTALGSYALIGQNTPSLFVFALLSYPIGGPPYFFITGVAGGFGYNRDLRLPAQNEVSEFPFVAGVLDPNYFGGNDPAGALQKLADVSQPKRGQYWLAAGIRFTSFQMLNSFALVTVSFGAEFELALLGLTTLDLPVTVPGGNSYTTIAHAGLQILVAFQPNKGQLAVSAVLTLDSFVLDRACHLTGGFAFYVWFPPNGHAGDFVITLGGYHPRFNKPAYYPDEPRVGLSWLMPQYNVTIRGGCYFALTPTAVMAGGGLELLYQSGNLRAWLTAQANFLIQWKPFSYDIDISVSVGASYRVDAWFIHTTFTVELAASVNIWGPPTGGKARVSWWVISFTIYFGPGKENKDPLPWPQFDESFLPRNDNAQRLRAAPGGASLERDARIDAQVSRGLIKSEIVEETGEVRRWIINPQTFEMLTSCVVPSTEIVVNTAAVTHALAPLSKENFAGNARLPVASVNANLGIVPMQVTGLQSRHSIQLTKLYVATGRYKAADNSVFDVVAVLRDVPAALWNPVTPSEQQQLSGEQVIKNVLVGSQLSPKPIPYDSTLPVPADNLAFEAPGKAVFSWGDIVPPDEPQYPQYPPYSTIDEEMRTLMASDVIGRRRALLDAVRGSGIFIEPAVDLSLLAATANQIFLAQPVLAPLGGHVKNVPARV
jgi:hypothetical protein